MYGHGPTLFSILLYLLAVATPLVMGYELLWRPNVRHGGRRIEWRLDRERKTEIISNKFLGTLQSHQDDGGVLGSGDYVVVWAREFLDDDILYDAVCRNIKKGIIYLYILDRMHSTRFETLLHRLYQDIPDRRTVDEAINVIFVRQELTLNNFVIFGLGTPRQCAYSALIYSDRPFGWVKQDGGRATLMIARVKTLMASVALAQAGALSQGVLDYFHLADQIMDFRRLGRQLADRGETDPESARFSLREVVAEVDIPKNSEQKVVLLRQRLGSQNAERA